jgi:SAM-dependent methyltransferase
MFEMRIPVFTYAAFRARQELVALRRQARYRRRGYSKTKARAWARSDTVFDTYWRGGSDPLRVLIAERLAVLPAESYLEVGCGAGANLYQLAQLRPNAKLAGSDLSEPSIAYAARALRKEGIAIELHAGPAVSLPYEDGAFDVVFTCGLLASIGPGDAEAAVQELRRVARKVVLLVEGHGNQEAADPPGQSVYWRRDYTALLPGAVTERVDPDAVIGHMDTLIMWTHPEPAAVTDKSR